LVGHQENDPSSDQQAVIFQRKESPPKLKKYQDYKPYLRKDFVYRCAYCLIHEADFGGLRNFHIDHFRPKESFSNLLVDYTNLYYSCALCNNFKGKTWPSKELEADGFGFVDPCAEDPYVTHFNVDRATGTLVCLTPAGNYTNLHLRLDRPQLRRHRARLHEVKTKCQQVRVLLLSITGLSPAWMIRVLDLLNDFERQSENPVAPYETNDLNLNLGPVTIERELLSRVTAQKSQKPRRR
jgi:uncharacterized protein (TIGR02646 family)